jgi:hypothetical protein
LKDRDFIVIQSGLTHEQTLTVQKLAKYRQKVILAILNVFSTLLMTVITFGMNGRTTFQHATATALLEQATRLVQPRR